MAAAAFAAYAGYAGWGFWATFAAVAVGTAIDSYLLAPAGANYEGPRLHDTKVITSTYGNPIPLLYGPENRISGNVIWSTGLIETKEEEDEGKGGGGSSTTTYSYRMSLAVAVAGNELLSLKRIWANNKLIYDNGDYNVMADVVFYSGTSSQMPDPTIESYLGAGNTPAYRNTAYVVLTDLQLADFGNRMPNLEFELEADSVISVGAVIQDICDRAGIIPVSSVHLTDEVRGYALTRNGPAVGHISPLGAAYFFDFTEQAGSLRFQKKGRSLKGTVPMGQMGGREPSQPAIAPITYTTASDLGMPKEVVVTYQDASLDYQSNSQRAFREFGEGTNKISMELAITMTAERARSIADRLLWEAWIMRYGATFRTDDTWVRRSSGELLGLPAGDEILPYKLTRATRGHNGVIEWEATREDPFAYQSTAEPADGSIPPNILRVPGDTELILIDSPILRDEDDNSGFYWAVNRISSYWRGCEVYRSADGGSSYSFMSGNFKSAKIGDVVYAAQNGPTEFWDRGNTIMVILRDESDSLESLDEDAVLRGNNACWIGSADGQDGEIIQYATATLVGPSTYVLSDLLRGRLGTEANVSTHGNNEIFVFLDDASYIARTDFGPSDWGKSRLYKPVSILNNIADTAAQSFTNNGIGKRPLSPVHVLGARDGSNNLSVSFVRRTRLRAPGFGGGSAPLGEETEAYEIDIYSGANVVRTITATTTSFSYSAADQTTDGLTPGNPVTMRIYQMSTVFGRGAPAIATV